MRHPGGICHRDVGYLLESVVQCISVTDSIAPGECAGCIVAVEDIVDVHTEAYLLDAEYLGYLSAVVQAQVAL
jgi:alanine-alpha-ketoisovalerate/valine-pyruvate aminotransferase